MDAESLDVALSLCELVDEFDRIEAVLLSESSRDRPVTPEHFARSAGLTRRTADDILLQLRRVEAANLCPGEEKTYSISAGTLRTVLSLARLTQQIVRRYRNRQPPRTEIHPLVTFPEDPSFNEATPQDFGMDWLMPAITGMINRADSRVVLLTPFLEREGFERIARPLQNTLGSGTDVIIVTRYLEQRDSHNRSVLDSFVENIDENAGGGDLSLVDYTVWPDSVSPEERDQSGVNPSFTLHSKLLLVDDQEVYLGSANVTDYGFSKYLEVGARLEGHAVHYYEQLADRLLASDAATELEHGFD